MESSKSTITKERHLKFVQAYLDLGYNGSRAYSEIFKNSNPNTCKREAYRLLRRPDIQSEIERAEGDFKSLARELELSKQKITLRLKQIIQNKDDKVALQGITTLCKLTGDFAPDKQIIIEENEEPKVDIFKMTDGEREEYRQKLLNEL